MPLGPPRHRGGDDTICANARPNNKVPAVGHSGGNHCHIQGHISNTMPMTAPVNVLRNSSEASWRACGQPPRILASPIAPTGSRAHPADGYAACPQPASSLAPVAARQAGRVVSELASTQLPPGPIFAWPDASRGSGRAWAQPLAAVASGSCANAGILVVGGGGARGHGGRGAQAGLQRARPLSVNACMGRGHVVSRAATCHPYSQFPVHRTITRCNPLSHNMLRYLLTAFSRG